MRSLYLICCLFFFSAKCIAQCVPTIGWVALPGGQVSFTGGVSGGSAPYAFTWYFGDNNFASTQNTVHTYQYNATYDVCFRVDDAGSCFDSICVPVQVTNAALTANCPGDAVFTTTANGPIITFASPVSSSLVILDYGDGSPAGWGMGLNHTYQFNGSYQVTAISVQNFGGAFLTCDTSTQTVNVTSVPCQANFVMDIDTNNYTISGTNISLGDANCIWTLNGTPVATNINYFQTGILPPGTYTLCIEITGPGGCIDTFCQTATLNYVPMCNATFSFAPSLVGCDTYDFSIANVGPPLTGTNWYVDGGFVSGVALTQQTLNFANPPFNTMQISVSGIASGPSCSSTWIHSFINPAAFYVNLDTTGSVNTWFAYPNNIGNVTSVLWDFGDGTTSSLQYPSHVYATPGTYNVCQYVTLNGTCNYTFCFNGFFFRSGESNMISNFVVVGPNGLNEESSSSLEMYPNPAHESLNINSTVKISEILISDINGKQIKVISGSELNFVDIRFLQKGFYFIQLMDENKNVTVKKIVKY